MRQIVRWGEKRIVAVGWWVLVALGLLWRAVA